MYRVQYKDYEYVAPTNLNYSSPYTGIKYSSELVDAGFYTLEPTGFADFRKGSRQVKLVPFSRINSITYVEGDNEVSDSVASDK